MVAAPGRIIRPVSPTAKTDSLDCRKSAELARKDMTHSIGMPTEQEEAVRVLQRRRHQFADSLWNVKQRIKGSMLFHGIGESSGLQRWSLDSMRQLDALQLQPILRDVLDDYLEELRSLKIKLAALERKMVEHTASVHNEKLAAARSVPGVSLPASFLRNFFSLDVFRDGKRLQPIWGWHRLPGIAATRHRQAGSGPPVKSGCEACWWKPPGPGKPGIRASKPFTIECCEIRALSRRP